MTNESNTCKVCGKEISLNEVFCPNCKFPQIIYPESLSGEVLDYEEKRVKYYRELVYSQQPADSPAIKGYLVMKQGEAILNTYPVYKGKNIYGKSPDKREDVFINRLSATCKELKDEHFMIEITDENLFKAKLLAGNWGVRNASNNVRETVIDGTDSIFVGDIEFILCSKR